MKTSNLRLILSIIQLFTLLITLQYVSSYPNQNLETPSDLGLSEIKEIHEPIEITSDQEFKEYVDQEGWPGQGTHSDPYRIENYNFTTGFEGSDVFDYHVVQNDYIYGGFTSFSLVISDVTFSVEISNNFFMYSVLISETIGGSGIRANMRVIENQWGNPNYPSNLYLDTGRSPKIHTLVEDNTFSGSNPVCSNDPLAKPIPRVYSTGLNVEIRHNVFDYDTGCDAIVQLVLAPALEDFTPIEYGHIIEYNWFKSSDIAIEFSSEPFKPGAFINNNDFEVGEFGIILNGEDAFINNNNFYSSSIGVVGQQNYSGMIKPITEIRFQRGEDGDPGGRYDEFDCGNQEGEIDNNHYSDWTTPDENNDGIVDTAYLLCNWIGGAEGNVYAWDYNPSTIPLPAYFEFSPSNTDNEVFALTLPFVIGLSSVMLLSFLGFHINFLRRKNPLNDIKLVGKTAEIVKDIFKSQTILYYTLIGQNKIPDNELHGKIQDAIPKDFLNFKFLLHPIKLSITKLLYENLEFTSIDIKHILDISWNDYHTHASSLQKKKYVRIEDEFIDDTKRQVLRLTKKGIEEYKVLTELLHLFLDNSTDYKAYIDIAQKRMEIIDRDLYPDN